MKVFILLRWFFKQERKSYLIGIGMLFFVAILQLVPPKIIGIVADEIGGRTLTAKELFGWLLLLILTGLTMYGLRYYWRIYIFGSSVKLAKQLRTQLYDHFTKMSSIFYQKKRIGDLMAHATNDIQAVQQTAGAGILTLVDSIATGGFVILAMATTISWKLTLISLLPMPIIAFLTSLYGKKLHKRFRVAQEAFSSLNDKTQESISGIKVLKAFGQEEENIASFRDQSEDVVRKNIAVAKIDSLYDPTISVVVGLSFFLSIGFGAKYVVEGSLTIGELIAFNTYLGMLIWPMLAFGWFFNIVERGHASYNRILSLLNERADVKDQPEAVELVPSGDIKYRVDRFSYPNTDRYALDTIHFSIKRGQTLGIVGKTGAGKTSILKLLIREFENFEGEIKIGNIPIQNMKLDFYRRAFGYVPQDHFLFSTTIKENIAFANPNASMEEIEEAAKIASVHEDILSFPNGYMTVVGERGVSLSGGQKQRISIARALLLNPEILILDDALSSVDAKTEEAILTALKENRKGKTTIITSHRLSAIQHADLIIVIENGKLVEKGTHEQLMTKEGWYRDMYHQQQLEMEVKRGGSSSNGK
ncbi:ABC transporter transmembrane domain-containing protein [Fervidibacillus halotolerans]|uniref:ABC transporter transmembrane domain-containing protein n=1 Tax=Fervidibacillus halotolerans TaxID=2980027 RepID=A0A9E8RY69_9BACI|nr:ABC transporter transmembrane domain-containing protein [Fervidibacillus halotolerans]WAA13500.1 ABC transporter transmembrane domain-containing protein [Fervidibacillus halotolerans]